MDTPVAQVIQTDTFYTYSVWTAHDEQHTLLINP